MDEPRVREMGMGQVLHGLHRSGRQFLVHIKLSPMIIVGLGLYVMVVARRVKEKSEPLRPE
jgi:hypothetical protein